MDQAFQGSIVGFDIAIDCRHDAGGHGRSPRQCQRIADRQYLVADQARLGTSEAGRRKVLGSVDLDERDVTLAVAADDVGGTDLAIVEGHLDGGRSLDDVGVGEDVAIRGQHDTGARSLRRFDAKEGVRTDLLLRAQRDHRGLDCLQDLGD